MTKRPATLKAIEPTDRERRARIFGGLISLCGLRQSDAADVLGLKTQTVNQKALGNRTITDEDLQTLRDLWISIQAGRATGLPEGAERVVEALQWIQKEPPSADDRDYGRDDDHDD